MEWRGMNRRAQTKDRKRGTNRKACGKDRKRAACAAKREPMRPDGRESYLRA